jgi:O-antigen ligase
LFGIPLPRDLALFFLAATGAFSAMHSPPGTRSSRRYWELILLLVAAIAFSIPAAPDIARSIRFSLVFLPALLIFHLLSEKMRLEQLLWLSNWIVALALLLGSWLLWLAGSIPGNPSEWVGASRITFLHVPNDVLILAILSPLSLAAIVRKPSSIGGIAGMLCLAVSAAVVVTYQSRSSVLLFALTLGVAGFLMLKRKQLLIGCLALPAFLWAVDSLNGAALLAKFSSTWDSRLPLWMASWCMFLKAPWFGNGPGSYLPGYRECLAETIAGGLQLEDPRIAPWAHNLYLEVLAEHGVVGFFSLIILLGYGIVSAYRIVSSLKGAIRLLNSSILAALIAFCVAANFELSLWRQWVTVSLFTLLGIAAGIHHVCQTDKGVQ